mmetsp:Transcript_92175/g.192719  ORF Transcript_92175/g.192719 Transcript_92175/m.192719 type:complete len:125 (+) Transcript_92175:154-528(+)
MPRGQSFLNPIVNRLLGMCSGGHTQQQPAQIEKRPATTDQPIAERTLLKNPLVKHQDGKAVADKEKEKEKKSTGREVSIDKHTSVPAELYWDMLKAGESAKNGGQHILRGTRSGRPHLVNSFNS